MQPMLKNESRPHGIATLIIQMSRRQPRGIATPLTQSRKRKQSVPIMQPMLASRDSYAANPEPKKAAMCANYAANCEELKQASRDSYTANP